MGISVSLILIAVGAILTWAVTATTSGIEIGTVGVILTVIGVNQNSRAWSTRSPRFVCERGRTRTATWRSARA